MQALNKPRDGFEQHVASLISLYATHQDQLGSLSVSIEESQARLARYNDLAADEAAAQADADAANKRLEMTKETRALQLSKVWSAMLEIYGKAKAAAKKDPVVAETIRPFARFMAIGPRPKIQDPPTK